MSVVEEPAPQRRWPVSFAPLSLVVGFGGAVFSGLIVGLVGAIAGASVSHPPPAVSLIATVLQDIALVASAVFFAGRIARPTPGQFGLRPTAVVRAAICVGLGYVAFLGFAAVWVAVLDIHDKEKIVDQLGANDSTVALLAVCLLTCVIAPICEEFFFRGFFFTALRNWRGTWPAALITGLVFGSIHAGSAPAAYLIPLAFLGVVLCFVYAQTGSLYPCIGLHALNNTVALGLTLHWRWEIPLLSILSLAAITLTLFSVARVAPAQ